MPFLPTKMRTRKSLHTNDLQCVRKETETLRSRGETVRDAVTFPSDTVIVFVSLQLPGKGPVSLRFPGVSQVETISSMKRKHLGIAGWPYVDRLLCKLGAIEIARSGVNEPNSMVGPSGKPLNQ